MEVERQFKHGTIPDNLHILAGEQVIYAPHSVNPGKQIWTLLADKLSLAGQAVEQLKTKIVATFEQTPMRVP